MTPSNDRLTSQIERDGFALLPGVFPPDKVDSVIQELTKALEDPAREGTIRTQGGGVYAARNVLTLWPGAAAVWRQQPLPEILAAILGPAFGLVRALFFDKPPDQTWALPWHKDLTIAVRNNRLPSSQFRTPTCKAGVPHVEASQEVLRSMLTVRIHLDEITEENGPLQVIPGSHRTGKELILGPTPPRLVVSNRGDVLLMRPLLAHCSGRSRAATRRHRRILHLEFAALPLLPDHYEWNHYIEGRSSDRKVTSRLYTVNIAGDDQG
jgi:hypothetical protein